MTRQAAPPAQRWLLLFVVLLVAPWLGQGVAGASTMVFDPASGPPGTSVTVTVTDFLDACVVIFDNQPAASVIGCDDTTLVFTVPEGTPAGDRQVMVVGESSDGQTTEQSGTFRVTAATATTTPPSTAATTTTAPAGSEVPATTPTSVAGGATASSTPPSTAARASAGGGSGAPAPAQFAAACPPQQVALLRFAVAPAQARPGTPVSAATSWGSVGTCTEVRPLMVLFDGEPVTGEPPVAGTPGSFDVIIPDGATAGSHRLALVAASDPSIELANVAFDVEPAEKSDGPLLAAIAAGGGALLLVLLLVLVRRRRRRRRKRQEDAGDDYPPHREGVWDGSLDAPDIAAETATAVAPPAVTPTAVMPGTGARDFWAPPTAAEEQGVVSEDDPTMPVVPLVVASGRDGSYYLLERQNPHAPRTGNGRRGWYRALRTGAVGGVVVGFADAHTAGAAASELATGETPASAHAIVDVDGVLELLPDDAAAIHRPDLDDDVLVVLLARFGVDPSADALILGHASAWLGAKLREHGIPGHVVTPEEFQAGEGGLIDDPGVPWHRMRLDAPPPEPPADVSAVDEPAAEPDPEPVWMTSEPPAVTATFAPPPPPPPPPLPLPPPEPVPAPAEAVTADPAPEPLPWVAPPPPPGLTDADPLAAEPAPGPRSPAAKSWPRPVPTPDELIAVASVDTAYYLLDNENPHATLRANGKHGWYYPTRYGGIRALVLHTAEGGDTAEAAADHLAAVDHPAAAHAVIDATTIVDLLPDETTALHGVRSSSAAIDLALVYPPDRWGTDPTTEEALLVRAAAWAGVRAVRHRIPVRHITVDEWHSGQAGIAGNGDADPGPDFPWHRFLQLTAWVARRVTAQPQPPVPGPPPTDPSETVRSGSRPT